MNKTKIFVIYHKPDEIIKSQIFQPIAVGKNKDLFSADFLRDDSGKNIADKNDTYNEMTAIYWVYTHLSEFSEYENIGFMHYRRLFEFNNLKHKVYVKKEIGKEIFDVNDEKINKLLKGKSFACPYPAHYKSVEKHYVKSHHTDNLSSLLEFIDKKSPEYLQSAINYFKGNDEYLYNMFILSKADFIKYCEFIFPILEHVSNENTNNERLFVSERLTGIFIKHLLEQSNRALFLPVINIRKKGFKAAYKQTRDNFKNHKNNSFVFKLKPLWLNALPRWTEQLFRRNKTR